MNVRARIEDAGVLWRNGRREGAFLSALAAVANAACRRYGDTNVHTPRQAFEGYVADSLTSPLSVEHRGAQYRVEQLLYRWFRWMLAQDAGLPIEIAFTREPTPTDLSVRKGDNDSSLQLSEGWFHHLVGSVMTAPEVHSSGATWAQRVSTSTRTRERT